MEEQNSVFGERPEEKLIISSKKKWLFLGITVALLNPVFAGLLLGAFYLSEPALRPAGRIVAAIAILWGAVLFFWVRHNFSMAPLGL